jgi:hypothetical protein
MQTSRVYIRLWLRAIKIADQSKAPSFLFELISKDSFLAHSHLYFVRDVLRDVVKRLKV